MSAQTSPAGGTEAEAGRIHIPSQMFRPAESALVLLEKGSRKVYDYCTMKSFLKSQPVETLVLVLIPLAFFLFFGVVDSNFFSTLKSAFSHTVVFELIFGGYFFVLTLVFLYIYFVFKGVIAFKDFVAGKVKKIPVSFARTLPAVRSWSYVLFTIGFASLANGVIILELAKRPASRVFEVSNLLLAADYRIFGVAVPFWLQKFNFIRVLDGLLLGSYRYLPAFLAAIMVLLLFSNQKLFRQFLLSFFLAAFLSIPAWYHWPAISPNEMYRKNILGVSAESIFPDADFKIALSADLTEYLSKIESFWIDPAGTRLAVTTNPSMHAAWGLLIAYFAIRLSRKLAWVFAPWAVLNAVGAVYVLEHYAVDIIWGVLMGVAAILIAGRLLALEKRYLRAEWQPFLGLEIMREDARKIFRCLEGYSSGFFSRWKRLGDL